jgi:hypothetical protein
VVDSALAALGDALDAAADALTAESLHHAINGVPSRAAATLDALARGDGSVPELDFLASPRSGLTIGHRVGFVVAADVGRQAGWAAPSPNQLRAATNPTLEALAEGWLPDPRQVRCTAAFTPTGGSAQSVMVRLSDCDISALDCVHETPVVPGPGAPDNDVPDRLTLAVTEAARPQLGAGPTQPLELTWSRTTDFAPTELTFGEFVAMCRLARELLQSCRALRPADLAPLGTAAPAVLDPSITARADVAAAALPSALAVTTPSTQQQAVRAAANFGVRGASYAATVGNPDPLLVSAIAAQLTQRAQQLDEATSSAAASRDVQRLQAVFGADFLPLPAFQPGNATDLSGAATQAHQPGWAEQSTIRTWLGRCARVRPRLGPLARWRTAAAALVPAAGPLATLQLPAVPGEAWAGAAFGGAKPAGPRAQVTLVNGPILDVTAALAGLVVDDWTETVPDDTATTGLAYHYQSPLSEPPQAVLLAVPADPSVATWTTDALEHTLSETLALAKLRTVDWDALTTTGQVLPAFYIANNQGGQTVSTDIVQPPPPSS